MEATLPDGALEALWRRLGAAPGGEAKATPLAGGFTGAPVWRVDLRAGDLARAVVVKTCPPREVAVMAAVADLGAASFPEVLVAGEGWFAAPFYDGCDLSFHDPAPLAVARDLARLHAAWETRPPPPGLLTCDAGHVGALLAGARAALAGPADFAPLRDRLAMLGAASPLLSLSDRLPRTLTHGDVHPGNIIAGKGIAGEGVFTLIDWGNAAAAPGMLDVANTIPIGAPAWDAYLAAYRAAGGALSDAAQALAWRWAKGVCGLMYLPWVAQHRPDQAMGLVEQALEADGALAAAGDGPLG